MIKPITLKCVKEFNNTSKWRGKLSTQQLLNSPLGKYLDINRTDAVAEVGINFHSDKASTFGIKIHPKRGDRYETKIYGHIQDCPKTPEKEHVILKGVDRNNYSNNKINLHLKGEQITESSTKTLFNDVLFDDVYKTWAKVNEIKDQLSFFVLDTFDQKSSKILEPIVAKKSLIAKLNKCKQAEIPKLDATINVFKEAEAKAQNIEKAIEDNLKTGKTIHNMSFRQLEKRKAQELADSLKNDYEIALAQKNNILEEIDNNKTIDTKKIDKSYAKNIIKKEKFCNTHNIDGDRLFNEYDGDVKVSGHKNYLDVLDKLEE